MLQHFWTSSLGAPSLRNKILNGCVSCEMVKKITSYFEVFAFTMVVSFGQLNWNHNFSLYGVYGHKTGCFPVIGGFSEIIAIKK